MTYKIIDILQEDNNDIIELIRSVFHRHKQYAAVNLNEKGQPYCRYYDDYMTRIGANLFKWLNEFVILEELTFEEIRKINEYSKLFTKDKKGCFDYFEGVE